MNAGIGQDTRSCMRKRKKKMRWMVKKSEGD